MPRVICCRRPQLRTPESQHDNAGNELLFDLVFASSVQSVVYELRTSFITCPEGGDHCGFTLHISAMLQTFFPFYWLAYQVVMYSNRFLTDEWSHNGVLYMLMAVLVTMAVHTSGCDSDAQGKLLRCRSLFTDNGADFPYFAAASSAGQAIVAALFWRARQAKEAKAWVTVQAIGAAVASLWWLVSWGTAKSAEDMRAMVALIIVVHIAAETMSKHPSYFLPTKVPGHLSARTRKFSIVMIATVVAGSVQPGDSYDGLGFATAAAFLLWVAMLKISYFDVDVGFKIGFTSPVMVMEVLWTLANYCLALSVSSMGACAFTAVKLANNHAALDDLAQGRLQWLLCVSTGGAMLSTTIVQLSLRGAGSGVRMWRKRYRAMLRVALSVATLFFPIFLPNEMPRWGVVLILAGMLALQICADLYGRQRVANVLQDREEYRKQKNLRQGLLAARDAVGKRPSERYGTGGVDIATASPPGDHSRNESSRGDIELDRPSAGSARSFGAIGVLDEAVVAEHVAEHRAELVR
eukprot:CAMPEP_0203824196 /NCGR_PEP_ID=MMETSP0115-20131106/51213_1 /ASSEMBLY_ACC=CAM_ASM_000227 /TAXON_ID=33651 /ORGANISM="Bicosoecid sp, Strain ms1" /LENGTH=521 /DNA_ID=CAMNT_0050733235 /DNA_START=123 /DNA_END=1684 /DNA_ORIENTATION=-